MTERQRLAFSEIDLPASHQLVQQNEKQERDFDSFLGAFVSGCFHGDYRPVVRRYYEEKAIFHRAREAYMCLRLGKEIASLYFQRPSLGFQPKVKILLSLGFLHQTIPLTLEKSQLPVKRVVRGDYSNYSLEALGQFLLSVPVPDSLIDRALLEEICGGALNGFCQEEDTAELESRKRATLSQLGDNEVSSLISSFHGNPRPGQTLLAALRESDRI